MTRVSTLRSVRRWGMIVSGALRKFFLIALAFVGVATLAGFIFWDADFYPVRDRWEIFKLAMFGEWKGKGQYSLPDDQVFHCEWEQGERIGTCILTPIVPEAQREITDAD